MGLLNKVFGRSSRYEQVVPEFERAVAAAEGWGEPNTYVPAPSKPPYYPEAFKEFLRENPEIVEGLLEPVESIEGVGFTATSQTLE